MMRLLYALVATVSAATSASAESDPDEIPVDSKEALQAIHDRGIVLKAGKRRYLVIVPRVNPTTHTPKGATFHRARLFFGDEKTLFFNGASDTVFDPDETGFITSPLTTGRIVKRADGYSLRCSVTGTKQMLEHALPPATESAKKLFASTKLVPHQFPYEPYLLAREEHGTTYYYVDRPTTVDNDSVEFRLFVGKRGAMKQLALKELSSDYETDVLVTAKGTLTLRKKPLQHVGDAKTEHAPANTVFFGTEKKRGQLQILDLRANWKLVYRDLAIYTRDTDGLPCEVL